MCSACLSLGRDIHFGLAETDFGPLGLNNDDRGGTGPNGKLSLTVEGAAGAIGRSGLSWGPGAVVTFAFRSSAPSTMPDDTSGFSVFSAQQISQTLLALQSWSDAADITFSRVGGTGYSNNATILFSNYSSGADGAAAFAYLPGDASVGAVHGDVWVNSSIWYNASPEYLNYGRLVLTHEIGHALGLRHPGDYNAGSGSPSYAHADYYEDSRQFTVMSYWSETNTGSDFQGYYAAAPLLDDIAAIQLVYGVNTTTRTGDTTYGFNSNAGRDYYSASSNTSAVIFAVWDGGGYDTLDFSGYTHHQTIDLRQGTFSSVGGLTGNVSIAQGAVIERAIGGVGNDTMYAQAYVAPVAVADLAKAQGQVNNSFGSAFSIDGGFHRMFDNSIISSTSVPHATVNAVAHGGLEHFSLTGGAGETVTIDIDGTFGIDTVVRIYSSGGALLASNDDGPIDVGSNVRQDSFLSFTLPAAGTYYIIVGAYAGSGSGGHVDYSPLAAGSAFTLNVSLTGVSTPGGAVTGSRLDGGAGADTLHGNIGGDILAGNDGNDVLLGAAGNDRLYGHAGNDQIDGGDDDDLAFGGDGADVLIGGAGRDRLYGDAGDDRLEGGVGPDQLDGGLGDDTLIGGADLDTASYAGAMAGVSVDLRLVGFQDTISAGNDSLSEIENLTGSAFADTLRGNDGANVLNGGVGADILGGYNGDDTLLGGADNDRLYGHAGSDLLNGDDGDDLAYGGAGGDLLLGGEGRDRLYGDDGDDRIYGGTGDDLIGGDAGADVLAGNAGDDTIQGGVGNDRIYGQAGNDHIEGGEDNDLIYGATGNDTLIGGAGRDRMFGEDGADTLEGGDGYDLLHGGAGVDTLTGGADPDTFVFRPDELGGPSLLAIITDFNEAEDFIDLRSIDADSTTAGNQAFTWAAGGFTGQAGEAFLSYDAGSDLTTLALDLDGDGVADYEIRLNGEVDQGDHFWL